MSAWTRERNPIEWVRQSAKRTTSPDVLTTTEVQSLLANLRFRERTLVVLAVTTGLRRSALFSLKWKNVDSEAKQIHVTRSIVQNVVGICKTESSQKPVPAHNDLMEALHEWRGQTKYNSPEDRLFASPVHRGRCPYLAQQIMPLHILPVARKLRINKRIGWHTFRHTYHAPSIYWGGNVSEGRLVVSELPTIHPRLFVDLRPACHPGPSEPLAVCGVIWRALTPARPCP